MNESHFRWSVRCAVLTLLLAPVLGWSQQVAPPPAGMLRLSTQGEVPLSDLIDYVSQRLQLRIIYDPSIRQKKVNLVAPDPIPVESLEEILQTVLINEGLVVTDTDQQGFKRITTNDQIPRVARPSDPTEDLAGVNAAVPLTRVFVLGESLPSKIAELVQPFLSPQGSNAIPLDRSRILILTDVARNVRRAEQLIKILDGEQTQVDVQFVPAKNVAVNDLADQLREILAARQKAMGLTEEMSSGLEVSVDTRTNSLILIGTKPEIEQATELLTQLDKSLDSDQRAFTLQYFSPRRLDEVVREILQSRALKPPYESRVEGNVLIVSSTAEVLQLVDRTQRQLDTREAPDAQSPVRFYKIKNVPAQELAETIQSVGGGVSVSPRRRTLPPRRRTTNDLVVPGPNLSPLDYPGRAPTGSVAPHTSGRGAMQNLSRCPWSRGL